MLVVVQVDRIFAVEHDRFAVGTVTGSLDDGTVCPSARPAIIEIKTIAATARHRERIDSFRIRFRLDGVREFRYQSAADAGRETCCP